MTKLLSLIFGFNEIKTARRIETKITYLYPIYTRKIFIKKIIDKYRINFKDQNIGLLIPKILEITYQGERVMETGIQILQNSIGLLFILFGTTFLNYKVGFTFFIYLLGFYILSFYRYKYTMPYSVNATKKFYKSADDFPEDIYKHLGIYLESNKVPVHLYLRQEDPCLGIILPQDNESNYFSYRQTNPFKEVTK